MYKKVSIVLTLILILSLFSTSVFAQDITKNSRSVPVTTYAPSTDSLINGNPESSLVTPKASPSEPYFRSYSPSSQYHVDFFKLIASSYVDNRNNPNPFTLNLNITKSTQQGSEWNGSVSFNGSIKAGVLGQVGAAVNGGVKEYRQTNEAVGSSGTTVISGRKQGKLEAYYGGIASGGTLTYRIYDTYTQQGYQDFTTPVNVSVHKQYLDVNYKTTQW